MSNAPNILFFPGKAEGDHENSMVVPCTEGMPSIFRVTSVDCQQKERSFLYRAHLFHEQASLTVEWVRNQPDTRIRPFCLVSPRWNIRPASYQGALQISRLVLMEHPEAEENLFKMVPHGWVKNRELIKRGAELVEKLPKSYRFLFNAIFWNGGRFRRYCTGPSSMNAHHNFDNGNLIHSVELAAWMRDSIRTPEPERQALAVLAGLLHDGGKADEYQLTPAGDWKLTDRGKLLGHKVTIIEWIAVAHDRYKWHSLPTEHYMALLHCLTSHAHAPEWTGIRRPTMAEAVLLSGLDQTSGQLELMERCAPENPGWGRYHKNLRGGHPYKPNPLTEPQA
ncbi:MAG: metal-dependent phosphohydrolase [Betaproteobacteria bacterium]|nr:metal-dependent phosphohydrolase [Betaproteobacteria bacterium]